MGLRVSICAPRHRRQAWEADSAAAEYRVGTDWEEEAWTAAKAAVAKVEGDVAAMGAHPAGQAVPRSEGGAPTRCSAC